MRKTKIIIIIANVIYIIHLAFVAHFNIHTANFSVKVDIQNLTKI